MTAIKEALTRFKELVESLECECDSYHGYTCPLHNDRVLAMVALQEYEHPTSGIKPTAESRCNCISGQPQTTGGCPEHGVKY